jgi:hypothetical protein
VLRQGTMMVVTIALARLPPSTCAK